MKKKFMALAAVCAIFLCGCSMLNKEPEQNGTIAIDFGNSTRALFSMNASNITWIVVSIDGPVSDQQGTKWGGHVEFENVPVGEYTVSVVPYIGDVAGTKVSVTVEVSANETAIADLPLAVEKILKTKFVMFNYNKDNGNPYKVYDSVRDIPSDFRITEEASDFKGSPYMPEGTSYAEDKNGDIYYISGDELRCKGKAEFNISLSNYTGTVKLYYDAVSDVLYLFEYKSWNGKLYKVNLTGQSVEDGVTLSQGDITSELLSSYKGFCVEGDKFFLYGKESNEFKLFYGKINSGSINNISEMTAAEIFNDEFSDAMITDMTIIEKGKIVMLLSTDSYVGLGATTTIKSRGAIAEVSYDGTGFNKAKIRTGGWFENSRKRTLTQTGTKPEGIYGENVETVELYGPSKSQRKNYFCGPKRIVCVRPKEVYIVDEGVNVRLADWTKRHDGCRDHISDVASGQYVPDGESNGHIGRSGNIFRVSRIVKVNLDTFAMSTEKEVVTPVIKIKVENGDNGQAKYSTDTLSPIGIFSKIDISGGGIGYVECPTTGFLGIHPFMEEE